MAPLGQQPGILGKALNFMWGDPDPMTGMRPWSPMAHLGMAQDVGRAVATEARANPVETASASGIPIVSDLADAKLAGDAVAKAWRQPTLGNLGEAGFGLGAAALPFLGMGAIKAYHGSPHVFDKFDMSKIGTGEGAQAYGHGLYFAENEGVARGYRDQLTPNRMLVDGQPADVTDPLHLAAGALSEAKGDRTAAASFMEQLAADAKGWATDPATEVEPLQRAAAMLRGSGPLPPAQKAEGALYSVNLDVNHDDLLDWDLPLYEQPPKVRAALQKLGVDTEPKGQWKVEPTKAGDKWVLRNVWGERVGTYKDKAKAEEIAAQKTREHNAGAVQLAYQNLGGNSIYSHLDKGEASRRLREAGIPGIRYLDAGSRGSGEGSRNIVLFDDALAQILERR